MKNRGNKIDVIYRDEQPVAVILDIDEYQEMLEQLEDLNDLKMLKRIRAKGLKFRKLDTFFREA